MIGAGNQPVEAAEEAAQNAQCAARLPVSKIGRTAYWQGQPCALPSLHWAMRTAGRQ
jgi:hypothetical protein